MRRKARRSEHCSSSAISSKLLHPAPKRTAGHIYRSCITERFSLSALRVLSGLSLLSTAIFTHELSNCTVAPKALWFRAFVLLAFPFYIHLLAINQKYRRALVSPLTVSVIAFALINLVATVLGDNPFNSMWGDYTRMGGVYHLLHLTLLYLYLASLSTIDGGWFIHKAAQVLAIVAAASGLYAIAVAAGMTPWVSDYFVPLRISSVFGNPLFFASFLSVTIPLTIYLGLRSRGKRSGCLYWMALILEVAGLVLTRSRGGILAIFSALLIVGTISALRFQKSWKYYAVVVAGVVTLGTAAFFMRGHLPTGFQRIGDFHDQTVQDRLTMWQIGWNGFVAHPFLGVGPENYYIVFNNDYSPESYPFALFDISDKPHNEMLEVMVTTGSLGFLGYLAMCGIALYACFRAYRRKSISFTSMLVLMAGLAAYEIQAFFLFSTPASGVAFYTFLGLAGGLWMVGWGQDAKQEFTRGNTSAFPALMFYATALASVVAVIATDWGMFVFLRDLTKAQMSHSRVATRQYLEAAEHDFFVFDRMALSAEAATFINSLPLNMYSAGGQFGGTLDDTIEMLERATRADPTRPEMWIDLAQMYRLRSAANSERRDPRFSTAANQALLLAPGCFEVWSFIIRSKAFDAVTLRTGLPIIEAFARRAPTDAEAQWVLALAYHFSSQQDLAVSAAQDALHRGYQISLGEIGWMLKYYKERGDDRKVLELYDTAVFPWRVNHYADAGSYWKVIDLYRRAVQAQPDNYELYKRLAAAYARVGEKERARAAAKEVLRLRPAEIGQTAEWLRTLQ